MKSQVSAWVVRAAFAALLPLFVALLILPWPKGPRSFVKTLLFVTQVLPLPAKPLQWLTRSPVREQVTYALPQGEGTGDLYRPAGGGKRAGVMVFLGIIPVPQDDPRVVNLGTALARLGFIALFPWSRAMMDKRITPEEPGNMVEAFNRLAELDEVDTDRLGMVGFCVGGSILAIAASDPRINDKVGFLSAFGAYHDIGNVMAQIASHTSAFHEYQDPWEANHLSKEVMSCQAVESLEADYDRQVLTALFLEAEQAPTDVPEGLSADGEIVFALLRSMTASGLEHRLSIEDARALVPQLSPSYRARLDSISPASTLSGLKARVLIAHDLEDDLVPVEESRRLAEALASRGDVTFTEFSLFSHVTPDKKVDKVTFFKEATKLFRYAYSIVRLAD